MKKCVCMPRDGGLNSNLASEFYIASQIFRLGYLPTITLGHTKEIDLLVSLPNGRTATIDVKGLKNKTYWPLPKINKRAGHFYVLVSYLDKFTDLNVHPEVFVIPSLEIEGLSEPWSRSDSKSRCISYRKVRNTNYKDAWGLLFGQNASQMTRVDASQKSGEMTPT